MAFQNDIVVYDAEQRLALVVEVKSRRGTNEEWAAETRRNLLAHGLLATTPYFLLALPDRFYLWVNQSQPDAFPDYGVDPVPLLNPFWGSVGIPEHLSPPTFEMIIEGWLATLTWVDELPESVRENGNWLIESGLFDAIKRGHLAVEVTI